jgi:hypothetical protein
LERLLDFDFQECLGSNRAAPQGLAALARMKTADWLDVADCRRLDQESLAAA